MENGNTEVLEQIELIVRDGKPMVSSLQIAERFGRNHKDVLRGIREIVDDDEDGFSGRNFAPTSIEIPQPNGGTREAPAYLLSRDAFMLVVMSYTGKEAMRMKKAYIQRFNEMEVFILNQIREGCSEAHITAGQRAGFHPQGERLVIEPRKLCTQKQLKGISGLLDFWTFISGTKRDEVEKRLCTAIPIYSLERLPQRELGTACQFLWRAVFAISEDSRPPATPEERLPLDGLLDFWVHCGNETRANVNNALCQSCNLSGINAIPAAELPRAMLVAFMGIVRHTFDGKQPQAREV